MTCRSSTKKSVVDQVVEPLVATTIGVNDKEAHLSNTSNGFHRRGSKEKTKARPDRILSLTTGDSLMVIVIVLSSGIL
ncbi:hypothetical protein ACOSQ2_028628 [Xanthoceras sorbifolium]